MSTRRPRRGACPPAGWGSALQLFLNLAGIVAAAVAVLVFYRLIPGRDSSGTKTGGRTS